jgi:hypothetical protein
MTPKEKAKELVDKYLNADFNCKDCDMPFCDMKCVRLHNYEAKECALIAVDEIINTLNYDIRDIDVRGNILLDLIDYWNKVKQEIKNYEHIQR